MMLSLNEFYDMLESHDWFYQMSDDPNTYKKGQEATIQLAHLASCDPRFNELLKAYTKYIYSGPAFGKPQLDKPKRP